MPKKRSGKMDKLYPKRKGRDGHFLCRWCGIRLSGRKENFCSKDCEEQVCIRVWPAYARQKVKERDHGICALCSCPTYSLFRFARSAFIVPQEARDFFTSIGWPAWAADRPASLWDMDHIHPVRLGGGLCGLDNLQTLCIPCHLEKTAAQASQRTKRKPKTTRRKKG